MIILLVVNWLWFALIFCFYLEYRERRDARKMIEEFFLLFPGKCPICSFERAAASNGVILKPLDHFCVEKQKRNTESNETKVTAK